MPEWSRHMSPPLISLQGSSVGKETGDLEQTEGLGLDAVDFLPKRNGSFLSACCENYCTGCSCFVCMFPAV